MKIILNLSQQCYLLSRAFQIGPTYQLHRKTCLSVYTRSFHSGLFARENNVYNKCILLKTVDVTDIAKRNATKKSKGKKKGGGAKVDFSIGEGILDLKKVNDDMLDVTKRLSDEFREKYSTKLTANTLDNIRVEIKGARSRLYEVAEVVTGNDEFIITCATGAAKDAKQIGKAIQGTLNIVTQVDESGIVKVPMSLSAAYKESILKPVKESAEKSKTNVRTMYQKGMKSTKKFDKSFPKEAIEAVEKQLKLLHDVHIKGIQDTLSEKMLELK